MTGRTADAQKALDGAQRGAHEPLLDFLEGKIAFLRGETGAGRVPLARALNTGALPPATAQEARRMLGDRR